MLVKARWLRCPKAIVGRSAKARVNAATCLFSTTTPSSKWSVSTAPEVPEISHKISRQGLRKTKVPISKSWDTSSAVLSSGGPSRGRTPLDSIHFKISEEVRDALESNRPVVALESTIYTHGLPYPDNIALAIELEGILRNSSVTPATIGFLNGVATIGLSPTELSELSASATNPDTMKVSRRDMPYIIGMGLTGKKIHGGTTVAATMYLAEFAGIKVFATGGIGGVHRGGQDTMDVSADLNELGRTRMCVIASGCKSFLDIPRTLEYLETQGVTVATYADNNETSVPFPAFYTRDSGVPSPLVVRNPLEAASIIHAQKLLGNDYGAGFLLANPIPVDFAVPKENIDSAIEAAIAEATAKGIRGHANTPFILAHIKNVTAGKSVIANRALIKSNVQLAAEVIRHYHSMDLEIGQPTVSRNSHNDIQNPTPQIVGRSTQHVSETPAISTQYSPKLDPENTVQQVAKVSPKEKPSSSSLKSEVEEGDHLLAPNVDIAVYGALAIDLSCDFASSSEAGENVALSPSLHTSNPARITSALGGVGHNVALAAHRATASKLHVLLCSYVADDFAGTIALKGLVNEGLDKRGIKIRDVIAYDKSTGLVKGEHHTAQYVAFNDNKKDLVMAMADMTIFDAPRIPNRYRTVLSTQPRPAKWSVIDANLSPRAIACAMRDSQERSTKILFEPVSSYKSTRLFDAHSEAGSRKGEPLKCFPDHGLDIITPNQYELATMHKAASDRGLFESPSWWTTIDALGIPSSGARDRFVQITNAEMTDAGIPIQTIQLLPLIPTILTKLGPAGVLHTELLRPSDPRLKDPSFSPYILSRNMNEDASVGGVFMRLHPPAEVVEDVVSVNGAGDTFVGVLVAGLASGMPLDEDLINIAQRGAVKTLRSKDSVSPDIVGILNEELRNV